MPDHGSLPMNDQPSSDSAATSVESPDAGAVPPAVAMAWLQLRMGWPSVAKIRLDQEKKKSLEVIQQYYRPVGRSDRVRAEFEQVLQRLEEEHAMRLRELVKEQRKAAKQQNNPIQIIQETNASKVQHRVEMTEETPPLIEAWKQLINCLF